MKKETIKAEKKYPPGLIPLERALSKLSIASRCQTKQWIESGKIAVNGRIIRDLEFLVAPEKVMITVDGKRILKSVWQTIAFHKPGGCITTPSDGKSKKTVFDMLPKEFKHLHAVGRLDMTTTGLLILTTDRKLSNFLTDQSQNILSTYVATVQDRVSEQTLALLQAGIDDGGELIKPHTVSIRTISQKETHITIKLREGKSREIRRMMDAVGHPLLALKRLQFGKLNLGSLLPKQYRLINKEDILDG